MQLASKHIILTDVISTSCNNSMAFCLIPEPETEVHALLAGCVAPVLALQLESRSTQSLWRCSACGGKRRLVDWVSTSHCSFANDAAFIFSYAAQRGCLRPRRHSSGSQTSVNIALLGIFLGPGHDSTAVNTLVFDVSRSGRILALSGRRVRKCLSLPVAPRQIHPQAECRWLANATTQLRILKLAAATNSCRVLRGSAEALPTAWALGRLLLDGIVLTTCWLPRSAEYSTGCGGELHSGLTLLRTNHCLEVRPSTVHCRCSTTALNLSTTGRFCRSSKAN